MSENESPPATSLQFDKAEYAAPQTAASVCCACKRPIAQTYYTVNAAIVCDQCHGKIGASLAGGSSFTRALAATAFGLLAGLAGAALWYAVRRTTGYEIGLIAILVGVMVGLAVRKGARGRGGWFYQTLAVVLTYSCISASIRAGYRHGVRAAIPRAGSGAGATGRRPDSRQDGRQGAGRDAPVEKPAPLDAAAPKPGTVKVTLLLALFLLIAFIMALAMPFVGGLQNIIGLLIIGIGLYEAWKINKRSSVRIAGPFQLAPPTASGAPGV